jgi:hypothetical protein
MLGPTTRAYLRNWPPLKQLIFLRYAPVNRFIPRVVTVKWLRSITNSIQSSKIKHAQIHEVKTMKIVMNSDWSEKYRTQKSRTRLFKILNNTTMISGENRESVFLQVRL